MKDWLRLYSIPVAVGLLITVPVVGILTFAFKATDVPRRGIAPAIEARYKIWPAGVVSRRHLADSYEIDDHGFLMFVDKERGVEVRVPVSQVQLIEPVQ